MFLVADVSFHVVSLALVLVFDFFFKQLPYSASATKDIKLFRTLYSEWIGPFGGTYFGDFFGFQLFIAEEEISTCSDSCFWAV